MTELRVTVDMDKPSRLKAETVMRILKLLGGWVFIRRSADHGLHIKSHGHRIPFWVSLLIRFVLGDDRRRVCFDITRCFKPKQLLFTAKDGKRAGMWLID